jgi:hypothetical protein
MSEYKMARPSKMITEDRVAYARPRAGRVDGSLPNPVRDLAARLVAHFNPVTDPAYQAAVENDLDSEPEIEERSAVVSFLASDGELDLRVLTYGEIAEAVLPLLAAGIPVGVGTDGSLRRQTPPSGPVGTGTDGSC